MKRPPSTVHGVRNVLWRRSFADEGTDAGLMQVVECEGDLQGVGRAQIRESGAPVELVEPGIAAMNFSETNGGDSEHVIGGDRGHQFAGGRVVAGPSIDVEHTSCAQTVGYAFDSRHVHVAVPPTASSRRGSSRPVPRHRYRVRHGWHPTAAPAGRRFRSPGRTRIPGRRGPRRGRVPVPALRKRPPCALRIASAGAASRPTALSTPRASRNRLATISPALFGRQ